MVKTFYFKSKDSFDEIADGLKALNFNSELEYHERYDMWCLTISYEYDGSCQYMIALDIGHKITISNRKSELIKFLDKNVPFSKLLLKDVSSANNVWYITHK